MTNTVVDALGSVLEALDDHATDALRGRWRADGTFRATRFDEPGGNRMPRLEVQIPAPDGDSPGTLHVPDGDGPWPGVLLFPDAGEQGDRVFSLHGLRGFFG